MFIQKINIINFITISFPKLLFFQQINFIIYLYINNINIQINNINNN